MSSETAFYKLQNELDDYRCPICWGEGMICIEDPPRVETCRDCGGTGFEDGRVMRLETAEA